MKYVLALLIGGLIITSCTNQESSAKEELIPIESPAGVNASLPHLISGDDGQLYLSWVESLDSGWVAFMYATLVDQHWSEPELIASGNNWFVNWADYPMISVDRNGNMIASYLVKSSTGTYSYDVNIVLKPKDGSWSAPIIPHDDGTPTEHGFVSLLPLNDDTFMIAWLDGRNTGGGSHDMHGAGAMTIRSAIIDLNGQLSMQAELDGRVCDCCQTGATMGQHGPMVVYRDRSDREIRDMSYVQLLDSGWTRPKSVFVDNWQIEGCPVNGPRISSNGNTVAVAWFTAPNGNPQVKVAFYSGDEFKSPIVIDQTLPIGRVDVALMDDRTAVVSWMDGGNSPSIKYRMVTSDGLLSEEKVITTISPDRGSGFPQLEYYNGDLYFAWTELGDSKKIMMAHSSL